MSPVDAHIELPLSACRSGECGEIVQVDGDGATLRRLREMGIEPGVMIRIARAGSPVILHVHGARLCLRGELADAVLLRVGGGVHPESSTDQLPSFSEGLA